MMSETACPPFENPRVAADDVQLDPGWFNEPVQELPQGHVGPPTPARAPSVPSNSAQEEVHDDDLFGEPLPDEAAELSDDVEMGQMDLEPLLKLVEGDDRVKRQLANDDREIPRGDGRSSSSSSRL